MVVNIAILQDKEVPFFFKLKKTLYLYVFSAHFHSFLFYDWIIIKTKWSTFNCIKPLFPVYFQYLTKKGGF